jgi:hypothetical protein
MFMDHACQQSMSEPSRDTVTLKEVRILMTLKDPKQVKSWKEKRKKVNSSTRKKPQTDAY